MIKLTWNWMSFWTHCTFKSTFTALHTTLPTRKSSFNNLSSEFNSIFNNLRSRTLLWLQHCDVPFSNPKRMHKRVFICHQFQHEFQQGRSWKNFDGLIRYWAVEQFCGAFYFGEENSLEEFSEDEKRRTWWWKCIVVKKRLILVLSAHAK